VTLLGYVLGNVTFVKDNIEVLLVLIVLVSVIPIAVEVLRGRRAAKRGEVTAEGRDERYDEADERAAVERKAFDQ